MRKFSKFKTILEIFEKFDQILKKFFKMFILAYYLKKILLTNYVSDKIEGHMPPQSTAAKNWGGGDLPTRLPGAPIIKPPQISKANFAYGIRLNGVRLFALGQMALA